jgi:hypothetical protein
MQFGPKQEILPDQRVHGPRHLNYLESIQYETSRAIRAMPDTLGSPLTAQIEDCLSHSHSHLRSL